MRKMLTVVAALAALAAAPTTAAAGGWVVVSLDSVPGMEAGEEVTIGFTVLRHGVTPESADDLVVVLTDQDGERREFPAVQQGRVGHHVATIVPGDGTFRWSVESGSGYVAADLGTLEVRAVSSGGWSWTWDTVQWGSVLVATCFAGLAVVDWRRGRSSRRRVEAAA